MIDNSVTHILQLWAHYKRVCDSVHVGVCVRACVYVYWTVPVLVSVSACFSDYVCLFWRLYLSVHVGTCSRTYVLTIPTAIVMIALL